MSAPDELRQLADRMVEDADVIQHTIDLYDELPRFRVEALERAMENQRAAAVALRHHANLTDENARLRELCGYLIDACAKHRIGVPFHSSLQDLMADIAGDAAAVSPPPAPTTCPTCRSDNRQEPSPNDSWICPNSWHDSARTFTERLGGEIVAEGLPPEQALPTDIRRRSTPTTCPTCGSDNPRVRERVAPVAAYSYPCPNSWHQAAT
jgi:hypothetical protein